MLQIINISQARTNLSQLVKKIQETKRPVVIVQDSTPVVVVYPYDQSLDEKRYLDNLLTIKGGWFSKEEFKNTRDNIEKRLISYPVNGKRIA